MTNIAQNRFHYCLFVSAIKASPDPGGGQVGATSPPRDRVSECVAFFDLLPNAGVLPGFACCLGPGNGQRPGSHACPKWAEVLGDTICCKSLQVENSRQHSPQRNNQIDLRVNPVLPEARVKSL